MSLVQFFEFPLRGDERGSLVAIEESKDLPFSFKRAYYIFGTKEGVARGFHAHRELIQFAICVSGSCKMLLDDGEEKATVDLNSPSKGVLIDKMVWHEMHDFSHDCVMLVLASDIYDEADYIRNYEDFLRERA